MEQLNDEQFKTLVELFPYGKNYVKDDSKLSDLQELLVKVSATTERAKQKQNQEKLAEVTGIDQHIAGLRFMNAWATHLCFYRLDAHQRPNYETNLRLPLPVMYYLLVKLQLKASDNVNSLYQKVKNHLLDLQPATDIAHYYQANVFDNPYLLLTVDGLGFDRLDKQVLQMIEQPSESNKLNRLFAYLKFQLIPMMQNGNDPSSRHEGPTDRKSLADLYGNIAQVFTGKWAFTQADLPRMDQTITRLFTDKSGRIERHNGDDSMVANAIDQQEEAIASRLDQLMQQDMLDIRQNDANQMIEACENQFAKEKGLKQFKFSDQQRNVIMSAAASPVSMIEGPAGTGKSTIVQVLLKLLMDQGYGPDEVALCAPTGKAAKNLSRLTPDGYRARTIHQLIRKFGDMRPLQNQNNPLTETVVIVDEMSMCGLGLFNDLTQALNDDTRLIMIGDPGQLDPVADLPVMRSLSASQVIPVLKLTHVYRQSHGSEILNLATDIRRGEYQGHAFESKYPENQWTNDGQMHYFQLPMSSDVDTAKRSMYAVASVFGQLDKDGNWMLIAPTNHWTDILNSWAQAFFNQKKEDNSQHELVTHHISHNQRVTEHLRIGDRIMNTKNANEFQIMNGDTGVLTAADAFSIAGDSKQTASADFDNRNVDLYDTDRWTMNALRLGYACTIHKAQGSTIDDVIMVMIDPQANELLSRELMYTGLTRAAKNLYYIGDTSLFAQADMFTSRDYGDLQLTQTLKDVFAANGQMQPDQKAGVLFE